MTVINGMQHNGRKINVEISKNDGAKNQGRRDHGGRDRKRDGGGFLADVKVEIVKVDLDVKAVLQDQIADQDVKVEVKKI